jgi:hemerythrin-like domain-containing protein
LTCGNCPRSGRRADLDLHHRRGRARCDAPSTVSQERTVQRTALEVIRDEHQALAAMLRSMQLLMAQHRRTGTLPDFGLLRAMLFYVDEFPERLHHPKESELLFPQLRRRAPELAPVLDDLEREHAHGEHAIRELEHALLSYEVMGEPRRVAFEQALQRYVDAYLHHMATEEKLVLPAAEQHLSEGDWAVLDEAFAANRDPLTGHPADEAYRPLFSKIVRWAPAPIGVGPALA